MSKKPQSQRYYRANYVLHTFLLITCTFIYTKENYLDVHSSQVQIDRATTIFKIVTQRISEDVNRKQVILAIVYQFVRTAAWEVEVAAIEGLDM